MTLFMGIVRNYTFVATKNIGTDRKRLLRLNELYLFLICVYLNTLISQTTKAVDIKIDENMF